MVINGGSRSNAGELAFHLSRLDTNERVTVRELGGVAAGSLRGALLEMVAVASGARSRLPLYHANIDWRAEEAMTDVQKVRAIDRLGEELGLTGKPRVVVEHVKEGREHLHVVWLRIDAETMKAIPDSHNFRKHEIVARDLEREFGHERVQGVHVEREGVERPARCPTLAEVRQAERSGMTPEEAKSRLRDLWNAADSGQSFAAALTDAGWMLAQGDRRGFVAVDPTGEARAVNKDITGLTAAKMRERLADLDADRLPSVAEARGQLVARRDIEHAARPELEAGSAAMADHEARQAAHLAEIERGRVVLGAAVVPQHGQAQARHIDQMRELAEKGQGQSIPSRGTPELEMRRALDELALTDPLRFGQFAGSYEAAGPDLATRRLRDAMKETGLVGGGETAPVPLPMPEHGPSPAIETKHPQPAFRMSVSFTMAEPWRPQEKAPERVVRAAEPVPALDQRKAEIGRLAALVAAARAKLTGLVNRLEAAFEPMRQRSQLERKQKSRQAESAPDPADTIVQKNNADLRRRSAEIAGSADLRRVLDRYRGRDRGPEPGGRE